MSVYFSDSPAFSGESHDVVLTEPQQVSAAFKASSSCYYTSTQKHLRWVIN